MKFSKAEITSRVHKIPTLRFEDQTLTSFAGSVVLQRLFQVLGLRELLASCFSSRRWAGYCYAPHVIVLSLVLHLLLGYRRLRDRDRYFDDPLIVRILGLRSIPNVATTSRTLSAMNASEVENVRKLTRRLVLHRIRKEQLRRITLDFDGSVLSTTSHAEGSAVGYNRKKKGARSYYPLFATLAQTSQFYDHHHRPGNVHDSNGAREFMLKCINEIQATLPGVVVESRVDSAFYDEAILKEFEKKGVHFSASLPFERFVALKKIVESNQAWIPIDDTWSYFETEWKPEKWKERMRVIVFRKKTHKQRKGPLQLNLFEPVDSEYQFKATVTNKTESADKVLKFHNGRGGQEKLFGEAKQCAQMGYIPCKRLIANQMFTACGMLAHNLGRELQMIATPRVRGTTPSRRPRWDFSSLAILRARLIQRAGRITHPQGECTLTLNANEALKAELLDCLDMLAMAA